MRLPFSHSRSKRLITQGLTALLSTAYLSGCMIAKGYTEKEQALVDDMDIGQYQPASRQMRDNIETQNALAQATFWSREYQLNPGDLESSIKLAAAVRKMGNPLQAIEIAQTARALYPRDPYLTAEYAAALIAAERGSEAISPLNDGLRVAPQYARLWSLMGAAHDQGEQYPRARQYYERALQITPYDPNILANLGLSYALAGDVKMAENLLRRAASQPSAGLGVKQNLDLVLQLQNKSTSQSAPTSGYPQQQAGTPYQQPSPSSYAASPSRAQSAAQSTYNAPRQTGAYPQPNGTAKYAAPLALTQQSAPSASPRYGAPSAYSATPSSNYGAPQTASDAARAAARNGDSRRVVVGANQAMPQRSVLDNIARSVGPKSAYGYNPYTKMREDYAQQKAYQQNPTAYGSAPTYGNAPAYGNVPYGTAPQAQPQSAPMTPSYANQAPALRRSPARPR